MSQSEIVKDFLIESYENLDRLDRDLVGLEKNPKDPEAMAGVFRTIHTIKGTCGFLGFGKLEKVAHVGENLLTLLRDGQLTLNPERTTALLGMVDAIRQMLKEIESTGQDGEIDYPELREKLTRLQSSGAGDSEIVAGPNTQPASLAPPECKPETKDKIKSSEKKSPPPQLEVAARIETLPPAASRNKNEEPVRKPSRGKIGGVLVERGLVKPESIALALQEQEKGDRRRLGEILVALGLAKQEDVMVAQQILETKIRDAAPETIRVGVNLLDKLMTLVGELVLARNQLLQFSNTVEDTGLQAVSQRMNLITTELQEEVMKTRMQPIGNIWAQFPAHRPRCRSRLAAKKSGSKWRARRLNWTRPSSRPSKILSPTWCAIPSTMASRLPRSGASAGKARGTLILRAFHEGGQVNIEISDDGAGLNARADSQESHWSAEWSHAEQAARMNEREIFNLIFLPGFSTAEKVTNVSGRGVGMDVVKTNVEKIGGTVDVQSTLGRGTTVRVKIPLTLAIIPALVVTCGGERYAIPQVSLLELVRLEGEEVSTASRWSMARRSIGCADACCRWSISTAN